MSASVDAFSLEDKNILITGASSGIGRECCIECSKRGANIVLVGRNEERLQDTLDNLAPGNHLIMKQELTEYEKLEELVSIAVNKLGKLNGFVHAAGSQITLPIKNMDKKKYEDLLNLNLLSGLELAKFISSRKRISEESASFVFIASTMAIVGNPGMVGYSASKGALLAASRSLAIELAPRRINVNCISPGMVLTPLMEAHLNILSKEQTEEREKRYPMGIGNPSDIANACVFLLSEASRWITGTNLVVDGGFSAK